MTLICAKVGADLITSSKVASRKTKWPPFSMCHLVYRATTVQQ